MLWILGVVVAAAVGLYVIGEMSSSVEQRKAPQRLAAAKAALARGHRDVAIGTLAEAFWVPTTDRYPAADAAIAQEVVRLFSGLLRESGMRTDKLLGPLEVALAPAAEGVPVPPDAPRLAEILRLARKDPEDLWGAVLGAEVPRLSVDLQDGGPGPAPLADAESQIVNEVGRAILFKSPSDAIALINERMKDAGASLKASLLNQRAGCAALMKDQRAARDDYLACVELEPAVAMHHRNLAETLLRLQDWAAARAHAERALSLATTSKEKAAAEFFLSLLPPAG
jgi:tetratricopeptide (TPR) repeat protein